MLEDNKEKLTTVDGVPTGGTTKSGNEKHGPDGQFIGKEGSKGSQNEKKPEGNEENTSLDLSDSGDFSDLDDINLFDSGEFDYLDDINLDEVMSKEEANKVFENIKTNIFDETDLAEFYNGLSDEEKDELLANSKYGYDLEKLKNASNEEKQAILAIEKALAIKQNYLQQQADIEKKEYKSAWKYENYVTANKYKEKEPTIQSKIDFYNQMIENSEDSYEKEIYKDKLNETLKFQEAGKKWQELNEKINNISEFSTDFESILEKYQDTESMFSKFRKDNAVWLKTDSQGTALNKAKAMFSPKFYEVWQNSTYKERNAAVDYTGAYSKFNEPLRGIYYSGSYPHFNFRENVEALTNMINKSSYDKDIWVQRGIGSNVKIFQTANSKIKQSLEDMTESELQSLVGTTFKENGFFSSGAGKETGFDHKNVILNTYCPRGTNMLYIQPESQYSSENEMILQRGYEYRITKVEKKGYRYFIDCEVIPNSNKDMPVGEELDKLWKTYAM